jgi:transposase
MAKRKASEQQQPQSIDFDVLEQINLSAAGADVGDEEIWVTVPKGRTEERTRMFRTFTAELRRLADWLETCRVTTLAMEATGVYWMPLYDILEKRGIEVYLVNPQYAKQAGARKDDVSDSQWIQQLHTYGLLRASFRPPEEIRAIRELVRHRDRLTQNRAAHIQHMQKALQQMNLKLTTVLSDITGVTGMQIIRAIIGGERDPHVLASYRQKGCQRAEEEIAMALEGHYSEEQLFILQQALEQYDFYGAQLAACDAKLEALYQQHRGEPRDPLPPPSKREKRRKNQSHIDLRGHLYRLTGVDLTAVDGLDALTVQKVIAEIGTDMAPWPSDKHFGAWLGLAPNHRQSGGKIKSRAAHAHANRAATALRIAAQTLWRSNSSLGAAFRRLKGRLGPAKATTALAYKLARIIYHMLKDQTPYRDPGALAYEQQQRERTIRKLRRSAARLGFRLEEVSCELTIPSSLPSTAVVS